MGGVKNRRIGFARAKAKEHFQAPPADEDRPAAQHTWSAIWASSWASTWASIWGGMDEKVAADRVVGAAKDEGPSP